MSASLPRPSASSCAGMPGRTAARGKIAAATQQMRERERLLSIVPKSREPATHVHHCAAPATPSSVDRASRLSHRSAEKLKQPPVIASISSAVIATPIPELPSKPEHGTDEGEVLGEKVLNLEVLAESEEMTIVAPTEQEDTEDTGESVHLTSIFDREAAVAAVETAVNNPDYVCAVAHLCRSVGNHTSLMFPCINCNQIAHHFCTEYMSEQNPVKEYLVIKIKDLSKEGKIRFKQTPSAKKCDIMYCILCEARWKALKVSAAANLASKRKLDKSSLKPSGIRTPKKKKASTTASAAVIRELHRVAAFYSQVYIFTKVEKAKANLRFALIEEHF
jgi:hypothetical protein